MPSWINVIVPFTKICNSFHTCWITLRLVKWDSLINNICFQNWRLLIWSLERLSLLLHTQTGVHWDPKWLFLSQILHLLENKIFVTVLKCSVTKDLMFWIWYWYFLDFPGFRRCKHTWWARKQCWTREFDPQNKRAGEIGAKTETRFRGLHGVRLCAKK